MKTVNRIALAALTALLLAPALAAAQAPAAPKTPEAPAAPATPLAPATPETPAAPASPATPATPTAPDAVDARQAQIEQGKALYQYWCSACHGRGPGHPGTQALEARYGGVLPAVLEERPYLTPEFVEVFVRNGLSIMPFFRKTEINDEELAAIGAYLSRPQTQTSGQTAEGDTHDP